jgi:hypothetical protein
VDRRRIRWVAAACVAAIAAGALVQGAGAWAAQGDQRCRRVAVHGRQNGSDRHSSVGAWRGTALRAVGCGAWRQMRQHAPHPRIRR